MGHFHYGDEPLRLERKSRAGELIKHTYLPLHGRSSTGKEPMPRVKNVGELDWNMEHIGGPVQRPYTGAESRCLYFKLFFEDLLDSKVETFSVSIRFQKYSWGIRSDNIDAQSFFPPIVVNLCQKLLELYPDGVQASLYNLNPA